MTWENSPNSRPKFGDSPNSADKGPSLEKSPNAGVECGDFSKLNCISPWRNPETPQKMVDMHIDSEFGESLVLSPNSKEHMRDQAVFVKIYA